MRLFRTAFGVCLLLLFASVSAEAQQNPAPPPATAQKSPSRPAASSAVKAPEKLTIEQIIARLPRRVTSKSSTPGDMMNFLLIGSKQQVVDALKTAGWVEVDRTPKDAILHAILETENHEAYSQMPMSDLYLFGRPQDYGWAEGIPIHVVTERNHFRLWQAPWLTSNGTTVWIGAGTHDIGVEKDSLGQLTHQIDPNVDQERDYIAQTLADAGRITQQIYVTPPNPVREALTATGDSFHSDGRILVVQLK